MRQQEPYGISQGQMQSSAGGKAEPLAPHSARGWLVNGFGEEDLLIVRQVK